MRSHPDFLPELDFVIELDGKIIGSIMYTRNKLIEENGNEKTFSLSDRYAFCPNINAGATANSCWNIHLNVPRRQAMTSSSFSAARTTTSAGLQKLQKFNICTEDGTFPAAMLIKELKPGTLENGKIRLSSQSGFYIWRKGSRTLWCRTGKDGKGMPPRTGRILHSIPSRYTVIFSAAWSKDTCIKRGVFRMRINSQNTGKH